MDEYEERDVEELLDRYYEAAPSIELLGVRDVSVESDGGAEHVTYSLILLADIEVTGAVIDDDGHAVYTSANLRDRLIVANFEGTVSGSDLIDVYQTGSESLRSSTVRFEDSYDAYEWLRDTLDGWCGITVEQSAADAEGDFPQWFLLKVATGRTESAEPFSTHDADWAIEFPESGVEISAVFDPNARAALGREDSFNLYDPVSLQSAKSSHVAYQPFTAIGQIWRHLLVAEC